MYAPIAGEVVATNDELKDKPEAINVDAFSAWLWKLKPTNTAEMSALLDAAKYQANIDAAH